VHFRGPAEGPAGEKTVPGEPEHSAAGPADSRRDLSLSTGHITSLIASLKLPPGRLSASMLSFAKFFSLPLGSPFPGQIRQKAPGGQGGAVSAPLPGKEGGPSLQTREAQALAALASAAKGVELGPEALAGYARALLHGSPPEEAPAEAAGTPPGETDRPEGRDYGAQGGNGGGRDSGGRNPGGERGSGDSGKTGGGVPGKAPGSPVREPALAAQGPLLGALNRLPGRDGKRWIVLPFSLNGLDICLRILLAPVPGGKGGQAGPGAYRAERMGLDIDGGEGAWRFVFHPGASSSCPPSPLLLEFSWFPAPGKDRIRAMERELAEFMGLPAGSVRGENLPPFAESRDWTLPSVNKEV
jgi:hypothetical protein